MADYPYRTLKTEPLADARTLLPYQRRRDRSVETDGPAVTVMTDLSQSRLVTVRTEVGLDEAQDLMMRSGVRMLMVIDDRDRIVGLVTSRDLIGEKPIHFASEQRVRRDEIRVADVMTPKSRMDVMRFEDVQKARVGDIVQTLRESARQHAVVVEPNPGGDEMLLRGIFSITQIGRQLGIEIEPTGAVQSFAELEAVLSPANRAAV
ncbi:MAG: CBS domain-containing protein [Gammaproteobacteria bacterium]|nr:CBS domain-containing protein [Gammaproteobacteria bacterium]